jgi:hypothetical protein
MDLCYDYDYEHDEFAVIATRDDKNARKATGATVHLNFLARLTKMAGTTVPLLRKWREERHINVANIGRMDGWMESVIHFMLFILLFIACIHTTLPSSTASIW